MCKQKLLKPVGRLIAPHCLLDCLLGLNVRSPGVAECKMSRATAEHHDTCSASFPHLQRKYVSINCNDSSLTLLIGRFDVDVCTNLRYGGGLRFVRSKEASSLGSNVGSDMCIGCENWREWPGRTAELVPSYGIPPTGRCISAAVSAMAIKISNKILGITRSLAIQSSLSPFFKIEYEHR